MTVKSYQYRAFEDVVGTENISADPVILDAYAWRSGLMAGTEKFMPRFEAVLLPQSTGEVQAIVRLCNRFKLQFKASSTGWGPFNDAAGPGVIKMDLRRMNRIIEINERNMYAVVEPYVIHAQLQAELMKRGLNCNVNGAGGVTSALPIAAHEGIGHMSQHASYGERNQLALEWVTPDGEIIRLGSLGSSGEWFCGDGPGPSLRGVVRGNVVPLGGLGVYTKAATKVYHWPGPPVFPVDGVSPNYAPSQMPRNFMIRFLSFPSEERRAEAIRKVGESEIGFVLMGFNAGMVAANIATSNEEEVKYFEQFYKWEQGPSFLLIIVGNSSRDFEYKKRALQQIVAENSGRSLPEVEDPKIGSAYLWRCLRITASIRESCRASGVFGGEVFGTDAYPVQSNFIQNSIKAKAGLIRQGLIYADSTIPFVTSLEHGHFGHAEVLLRYSPSPETMKGIGELLEKANQTAIKGHFGLPHHVSGDAGHDIFGPHLSRYHLWLRKIKKTFDPNGASESTNYISAKE
jgi:glycolate oxidase